MIVYGLLMPLTILDGMAMSYFSLQSSLTRNWLMFIGLILINIAPIWAFISKYSKNIVFDELLFVVTLTASELITVSLLKANNNFSTVNWAGMVIAFAGLILMKLDWKKKKS